MACLYPITAFKIIKEKTESGKSVIVFNDNDVKGRLYEKIQIPCSRCIECRIRKQREWAIRCYHEASLFDNNIFVTLTYDDENLPEFGSLRKEDYRKFIKDIRRKYDGMESIISEKGKTIYPIRYFACGEYGDKFDRPHYHLALFNFDFKDKKLYKRTSGIPVYNSDEAEKIWKKGYVVIGDINLKTVQYITRYILKKINGKKQDEWPEELEYEFQAMSRRPGIAKRWFQKYKGDINDKDFLTIDGKMYSITQYYDKLLEECDPLEFCKRKNRRKVNGALKKKKLHKRANVMRDKRLRKLCELKNR